MGSTATEYHGILHFNAITTFMHGFRFAKAARVIASVATDLARPVRVLDIGCAYGELYGCARDLCRLDYLGIDHNESFLERAHELYSDQPGFEVRRGLAQHAATLDFAPDVVVALEVLEHLPEPDVGPLLAQLATVSTVRRYVFSVPVEVGPALALKNVGSALMGYVRHREYTWRDTFWAATYRLDKLPAHGTDHKGFDWRWLRATIRQHFRLRETRCSPFNWMPACVAPSIMFVCEHR